MTAAPSQQHVVVGMSGGVDSSVAALLLKNQGYKVTAVFMKNWEEDDTEDYCSAEEDLKLAREVCNQLELPLFAVNFSAEYWDRVFSHFLSEYKAHRTPNPDVLCNKEIKFKAFLDYAINLGADYIATGHYAGVRYTTGIGEYELVCAKDKNKDQTYFLHLLDQTQLSRTLFPLSDLLKPEIRNLAKKHNLPNYARKDSTGICFIGERKFNDFLNRFLPAQPGDIFTLDGTHKGRHQGLMYHTIGQRQGLGIGGPGGPWYVASKDIDNNILYIVEGEDHPALYSTGLVVNSTHWIGTRVPDIPLRCQARCRHRQPLQDCVVDANSRGNGIKVLFDRPQRAITPGQSVVFYLDDVCLGGGIIQYALAENTDSKTVTPMHQFRPKLNHE